MKRLLAYLFIVLGFGLIFNINSKAASMTFHKYFCVNNPGENYYFSRVNKKEDCSEFKIVKYYFNQEDLESDNGKEVYYDEYLDSTPRYILTQIDSKLNAGRELEATASVELRNDIAHRLQRIAGYENTLWNDEIVSDVLRGGKIVQLYDKCLLKDELDTSYHVYIRQRSSGTANDIWVLDEEGHNIKSHVDYCQHMGMKIENISFEKLGHCNFDKETKQCVSLEKGEEMDKIRMIQIDEPALREGLPLKRNDWDQYLKWSVNAFRISAAVVKDETQIHTHMCYAEFEDIIESIAALDADVISIETSRSRMELLKTFEQFKYPNEIGPGVYDIHSPRVPKKSEMVELIKKASKQIDPKRLWVNPDCGLKTRGWPETIDALKEMVAAAKELRG